jgi:hypothetical protein
MRLRTIEGCPVVGSHEIRRAEVRKRKEGFLRAQGLRAEILRQDAVAGERIDANEGILQRGLTREIARAHCGRRHVRAE